MLKLDQELLRFLVVVNEGEPTNGVSVFADRPEGVGEGRKEDDEEEDDDRGDRADRRKRTRRAEENRSEPPAEDAGEAGGRHACGTMAVLRSSAVAKGGAVG